MDTAPRLGQSVGVLATVTEVHHADDSSPPEYQTVMLRLPDGQQVMTHWANLIDTSSHEPPRDTAPETVPPPEPPTLNGATAPEAAISHAQPLQPPPAPEADQSPPPVAPPATATAEPTPPPAPEPPPTPPAETQPEPVQIHTGDSAGAGERS